MRVVAGSLGGRRLESPQGERARPTSDRVREAVFNALASRDLLDGATVLDLFAGTGALGIEALSRGAAQATFVESDRAVRAVLERNLAALDLSDRTTVHPQRAERFLADRPPPGPFDLALLDPPYAFDGWLDLLDALPATTAVLESDRPPEIPAGWDVAFARRYGGTLVTFVQRARLATDPGGPPDGRVGLDTRPVSPEGDQ